MFSIELPWPPASLSGHNTGHWSKKAQDIKALRIVAKLRASKHRNAVAAEGDICLRFTFNPADNRGDRVNYFNRCKPLIDGIADGLGVNDKRFIPIIDFASFNEPSKSPGVIVEIMT